MQEVEASKETVTLPAVKQKVFIDHNTSETAKSLLNKISWVMKCITTQPVVPILENLLFTAGVIMSSDLSITAMHKTAIRGNFLIPGKKLLTILKTLNKTDKVSFRLDINPGVIVVVNDEPLFKLSTDTPDDFPKHQKARNPIGILTETDVEKIIEARLYVSTDSLRPALCGVFIQDQNLAATNGHYLYWNKLSNPITDKDAKIHIPTKVVDMIKDFKTSDILASETKIHFAFRETERVVIFRSCDETFPDYKNVIPTNNFICAVINKKVLVDTIKMALITANKTTHQGRFKFTAGSNIVVISSEDIDFSEEFCKSINLNSLTMLPNPATKMINDPSGEMIVPFINRPDHLVAKNIEVPNTIEDGDIFEIGFNFKFLLDLLKDVESAEITMEMSAANKAMIVNSNILIMPIMLNQYI